jgi:hypothetical protein
LVPKILSATNMLAHPNGQFVISFESTILVYLWLHPGKHDNILHLPGQHSIVTFPFSVFLLMILDS